jgi:CheY-like chemotaxis protein
VRTSAFWALVFNTHEGTDLDARSPKILCVDSDPFVLESRCAVLKYSGYDAASASPQAAEVVLRSQKFDLIVISTVSDQDLHRILSVSDGAEVLVLDGLIMASKLLSLVAQRLQRSLAGDS